MITLSIKWYPLAFCLCWLSFAITGKLNAQCHIDDFTALKALYESTNGADWTNRSFWDMVSENETPLSDCDLSFLHGVSLNVNNRVNIVDLFNNNLSGELPSAISTLSELTTLSLNDNNLVGSLPQEIGELSQLSSLSLSNNNFNGTLPESIVNLKNLDILFLDNNQFSGVLPADIVNLDQLEWFFAEKNQFTGDLPIGFGNLTNLIYLSLYQNNFEGIIPDDLDSLKNLKWALFHQNNLSGCYPSNICSLTLDSLNLSENLQLPNFGNFTEIDSLCMEPSLQIGLPCNDGNEETTDDNIQSDCTCSGELMIDINEVELNEPFTIYPNPSTSYIQFSGQFSLEPLNFQLLNRQGQIALIGSIDPSLKISIEHLDVGIYYLQFFNVEQNALIPIIKM